MPSIYLVIGCGPDYDVEVSAHATREQAQAELCAWLEEYGDDCADEITAGKVAVVAGETAYMGGGEHWYEVRAVTMQGRCNDLTEHGSAA